MPPPQEEAARQTLRQILDHMDAQAEREGIDSEERLRDAVEASLRSGRLDPARWGLTVEQVREIAVVEIEDIYTCEHGVRLVDRARVNGAERCLRCRLTERDREIVALIVEGFDTAMIAEELDVSRYTIRDHIRRMRQLVGGERMTDLPRLVEQFEAG